jgi:hypothetical protein
MACCPCSIACCIQIPCVRAVLRCCYGDAALERAAMEQESVHAARDAAFDGDAGESMAAISTPSAANAVAVGGIHAQTVGKRGKPQSHDWLEEHDDDIVLPHQRQHSNSNSNSNGTRGAMALSPRQAVGSPRIGSAGAGLAPLAIPLNSPPVGPTRVDRTTGEPMSPTTPGSRRNRGVTFARNPAAIAASPTALVHSTPGESVRPIRKRTSSYGPAGMLGVARTPPMRAVRMPNETVRENTPPSIDQDLL